MAVKKLEAYSRTQGRLVTVKLSDYPASCFSTLPLFCQKVCGCTRGQKICRQVREYIKKIREGAFNKKLVWIFCCHGGAKVVVLYLAGVDYLIFCRSSLLDERHLQNLIRHLKFDAAEAEELERRWKLLPRFGTRFVERLIEELAEQTQQPVPEAVITSLKKLANAYTQFELDIAVFNALLRIGTHDGDFKGVLKIDITLPSANCRVVRVITKRLGQDEDELPMPIIGLAFEDNEFDSLENWLESWLNKNLEAAILDQWANQTPENFRYSGYGNWEANVALYFDGQPTAEWRENTQRLAQVGLHRGGRTTHQFLSEKLRSEKLQEFKTWLSYFSEPESSPTVGKQQIFQTQTFADLYAVLSRRPDDSEDWLRTRKEKITDILSFADYEEYPLLIPAPQTDSEIDSKEVLANDIIHGSSKYTDIFRDKLIPKLLAYQIAQRDCDPDRIMLPVDMFADFLGMFCMGITAGIIPWYRVSNTLRKNWLRWYMRRLIKEDA